MNLQIWGVDGVAYPSKRMPHYSDLVDAPFPKKSKLLSWITTGDYTRPSEKARIDFLVKFTDEYPGVLDLYGRNEGAFDLSSIDIYKGPLVSKWDSLNPYEYAFAFENICEPNYMSEKFNDAIIVGCVPVYWGMTNIGDYYPEGSFIELNITKEDAPQKLMEIISGDHRGKHMEALKRAKDLFLNQYQFWPALHWFINELVVSGRINLELIDKRRHKDDYKY